MPFRVRSHPAGFPIKPPITAEELGAEIDFPTHLADYAKYTIHPVLNAKAFGAKGDGITPDSSALQEAINTAINTKLPLYIPRTDAAYIIDSELQPSGGDLTILSDGATLKVKDNTITRIFNFTSVNNIRIRGLRFDGNKGNQTFSETTTQALIYVCKSSNIYIEDCEFADGISNLIYLVGANFADEIVKNIFIEKCSFLRSNLDAMVVRKYVQTLRVKDCIFDTWGDGNTAYKGISVQASRDVVIRDSKFLNTTPKAGAGVIFEHEPDLPEDDQETDGGFIENCYFEGMYYNGIKADDCRNIVIRDCYIKNVAQDSSGMGIWLAGVIGVLVEGCTVKDINSTGIYLQKGGDTQRRIQHARIVRNTVISAATHGIFAGNFKGVLIEGNSVKNSGAKPIFVVDGDLGVSDYLIVRHNFLEGNTEAMDVSSTGTNKDVSANYEY